VYLGGDAPGVERTEGDFAWQLPSSFDPTPFVSKLVSKLYVIAIHGRCDERIIF
jgi:hypothetical protein